MLKHFVIFKFEENFFKEENLAEFNVVFAKMKSELDGILDVSIRANCINRPANMDLMIEMDLKDESILPLYLNYPDHVEMGRKYNPHVINRVSFDYEL